MQPCAQLCKLRPEIVNLDLPDQLALIRGCHEADAAAYSSCAATRERLIDWIKAEK